MHLTQKGLGVKTVTGQKKKYAVLRLAEKIVELCRDYTTIDGEAIAATQIAREVILTEQAVQK